MRIPAVVPERSARRVLTSEWVDGTTFSELPAGGARSAALMDLLVAKDSAVAAVPAYVPSGEPGPYGNG